jgi:hypothetical protein
MRYEKGTIHLNETKDIPLLQQVFQSAYATQKQLFEFMQFRGCEDSEGAHKTRLARLVKHDLVRRHAAPGLSSSLYSISSTGRDILIYRGIPYAGRGCGLDRPLATAQHAVDLNGLHLALFRSGWLREWVPETEICSQNILTNRPYAKDYDAIVVVAGDNKRPIIFALEYERSQKTDAEYQSIAIELNREARVDFVLYVTTRPHLLTKISGALRHCRQSIALCLAPDLHARLFDARIVLLSEQWRMTLGEFLELKRGAKAAGSAAASAVLVNP